MSLDRIFSIDRQIVPSIETPNRDYRLDPSRYSERGERMLRHLKLLGFPLPQIGELPEFRSIYLPNRFSRNYLDDVDHGVPMLGTSTMFMVRLPVDSRIPIKDDFTASPLRILPGDILISRSGTVGTTVLCGESYTGHVASDDCFRLRLNGDMKAFTAAYLQSPFGKTLLTRDGHGKVIRHLKERDIRNLRVPIIPSSQLETVSLLMSEAVKLTDDARKLLMESEMELDIVLGIPSAAVTSQLWLNWQNKSYLKASDSLLNNRLDPHFYDPDIGHLRNALAAMAEKTLGEISTLWMPTRFARPRAERGFGIPFYSSADIMRAHREPSATISNRASRYLNTCMVETETILICRSGAFGGIMGRAMFVSPGMDGWAISEHMVRCKVTDSDYIPEYVFGCLGSLRYGYPLITAYRHGKDVPELDPSELGSIPIPKLAKKEQERIAQPIREALANLDRANELERESQRELLTVLDWSEDDEIPPGTDSITELATEAEEEYAEHE